MRLTARSTKRTAFSLRSSKRRENGIGIQSVTRIAEKTGGTSTFTHRNGTFTAKVMLCG